MKNRRPAPAGEHIFKNNRRLIDKLNAKAHAGLPEEEFNKAYARVAFDSRDLDRANEFDDAGHMLISKAAATYEDLHIFCKMTRGELRALYAVAADSNETLAAKCLAALQYKSLAGERP